MKALAGVEAAFLLSPLDPSLPAWEAGFARAAKKAGVKRLVKLSALGADPVSSAAIARWHGEAESEIARAGVPFTILRPAAFYQNLLRDAASIRRGTLAAPMGAARVAMVDARDVGAAAAAALVEPPRQVRRRDADAHRPRAAVLRRGRGGAVASARAARRLHERRAEGGRGTRHARRRHARPWLVDAVLGLAEQFRAGRADLAAAGGVRALGREPISFERFVRDHAGAFVIARSRFRPRPSIGP